MHRHPLSNGLRLWCQPHIGSNSVAALLAVGAGLRYENPSINGIFHFIEHMLFAGSERWTAEQIREIIPQRGGRRNAWTGLERTIIFTHVLAQDLDIALEWLAQVVFRATSPADKVDQERRIIFQEKQGRYGWLLNRLERLAFGTDLTGQFGRQYSRRHPSP